MYSLSSLTQGPEMYNNYFIEKCSICVNTPWGDNSSTQGQTDLGCYTELREKFKGRTQLLCSPFKKKQTTFKLYN